MLFGLGHPMLDISATVDDELLRKYSLNPNDAVVADEKHTSLYTELVDKYHCEYTSGGTVPNTLRVFQCVVQTPEVATFVGCIGRDEFGAIIEQKAKEDGVRASFQYSENEPTACCAVLLTKRGTCRSLCTRLGAARLYSVDHLLEPKNRALMEEASHYYASGFLLNGSLDVMVTVARHASNNNKIFCTNLGAPFLCRRFKDNMLAAFPYIDIIFGNETEAREFADVHGFETEDLTEIADLMSKFPKENKKFDRMVVITQGTDDVIVAQGGSIWSFPVPTVEQDSIRDTNGAGDAFVGGFLAMHVQGRALETCVRCGIAVSAEVIKNPGCALPGGSFVFDE